MGTRTIFLMAVVALATTTACSSGGGGGAVGIVNNSGNPSVVAAFNGSGTAPAAESVQLAGVAAGDQVNLSVDVGSPVASEVRSFSFDLLIGDPAVIEYVAASATVGSGWSDPASVSVQVSQQGDRIIVGVARLGSGGAGFPGGTVVDLMLRVRTAGASTIGFAQNPAPTAMDGNSQPVASVQFDAQDAVIQGN